MSSHRATVTYTAQPQFLSTDHWKQVYNGFLAHTPLRNLHWKSASHATIRTIQELQVNFVDVDSVRDEHTSQVPQTLLERPLLNAYIAVCEDTETYKNIVKKQIKDWQVSAMQKKNQEWLVVHVVRPDRQSNTSRLFQMRTSVLDRMKADFNVDKRDRCVQLVWSQDYDNPTAWADLISKVKDGLLLAFEGAVAQREEEVRRSEGQRQMPGWNFCTYFILKESLASSFEGMCLHEEALDTYEELEAVFFQVMKEKSMTWFGALITPTAKDDSSPLLSVTKKPYRDLILANSISVFDFRVYLLARQCNLLSSLGRVVDIAQRSVAFLRGFGRKLREIEAELPSYFIESWTYSSALSVVENCEKWAQRVELTKPMSASFSAVKGELIELARNQLDILGIDMEFLPSQPPFSDAVPNIRKHGGKKPLDRITKQELKETLQDKDAFYDMYIALTKKAIELYANAGRRKFALRLHGSLAALDVVRGQLASALQTYTSLPAHYAPHSWTSLEAFMLTRALDLHAQSEKPRDRDWILVLLEFLKAYIQDLGKSLLITHDDHVAYTSSLVKALKDAANSLQGDLNNFDHPAITISVSGGSAKLAGDRDGAFIDINVINALPCEIPIDEIVVILSGRESNRLTCTGKFELLAPGSNKLQVFCPSATTGTYSLHSTQVKIARLNMQWNHAPQVAGKGHKLRQPPTLIHIPKDPHALNIDLRQPQRIERGADKQAELVVVLTTGRNNVSKAMLRITPPSGIQILTSEVKLQGNDQILHETIDDSLVFFDLKAGSTLLLSVPHTDASSYPSMRVDIVVDYVTVSEPAITRTIRVARVVQTTLPLSITMEDFFRGTRLFTRFTLSTTSYQYVRVKKTELLSTISENGVKISKGALMNHGVVTVTPDQPGRFLFQLDSKKGQDRDPSTLHITYRMLREEVEAVVEHAVKEALSDPSLEGDHIVLVQKLVQALEGDASWVDLYVITGELAVPNLEADKESDEALSRSLEILKSGKMIRQDVGDWREFVISVDVPQVHILAAVRLRILPNPFATENTSGKMPPLYAGQPISAMLTVTTSFHWAPHEDSHNKSYRMRFDIEMTRNWLVSGRKRGDFVAKDGQTVTVPVTLIALHHGELPLPKVAVSALPLPGEIRMGAAVPICETYQMHGAEKMLVLPRGGRTTFVVGMGENEGYQ